jgi:hypothetical protein
MKWVEMGSAYSLIIGQGILILKPSGRKPLGICRRGG